MHEIVVTAKVYLNGHPQATKHGLEHVSCSFSDCPGESGLGDALLLPKFFKIWEKGYGLIP